MIHFDTPQAILTFYQDLIDFALHYSHSTLSIIIHSIVCLIIFLILVMAWLFNKAKERAIQAQIALTQQRDELEILVAQRSQELHKAQLEKMTQLYQFAEVGRTLSGLLHDLSTPLTLVSVNLHQLRTQEKTTPPHDLTATQTALQLAIKGTKNIEKLVISTRRLLQNQEDWSHFSIKKSLSEVMTVMSYKAKSSQVQVTIDCPPNIIITTNLIRFHQLMANLISNAIDACANASKESKKVEVRVKEDHTHITVEIKDYGCGIAQEHLSKVFDPLFTTKDTRKGIGLGLSIVKEIVEKYLHGTITVESQADKGTLFTIIFPITPN